MADCINRSHPDYQALLNKTGLNPLILNAKISVWQEDNSTKEFPSAEQVMGVPDYFDVSIGELEESNLNEHALLTAAPEAEFSSLLQFPIGELVAYRLLKEQMLENARERTRNLDNLRRKDSQLGLIGNQQLSIIRKGLTDLQFELEGEIDQLRSTMQKSTTVIAPLIERDLERARFLSKSLDPLSLKEAKEITDFIANMAEFSPDKIATFHYQRHPLYTDEELEKGIPADERAVLNGWALKAKAIEEILSQKRTEAGNDIINNITGITSPIDINQIKKRPLADTSWVDMMIMDITHGIFSQNGLIPQAMSSLFSSQMEIAQAEHRRNEDKIKALESDVKNELKKLKAQYPALFDDTVTGNHADYSIFFQQDANGMYSNGAALVDRYTPEYNQMKTKNAIDFRATLKNAFKLEGSARERAIESAYDKRFKWIRDNEIIFDPRMISAVRDNPLFSNFRNLFDQVNNDEVLAHEQSIKALIGQEEFEKKVKQLTQIITDFMNVQLYTANELMAEESKSRVEDLSNAAKAKLDRFIMENSPFILANSIQTGRVIKVQRVNGWFNVFPKSVESFVSIPKKAESYDNKFKVIYTNETLKQFYDIAREITEYASAVLPVEYHNKIKGNSLYYLPKTAKEIIMDNDGNILARLYNTLRAMWANIIATFGMESQSDLSFAHKNYITGEQNYKVNSSFATRNLSKIEAIRNLEVAKFKTLANINGDIDSIRISDINPEATTYIENIIGHKLDTPGVTHLNAWSLLNAFAHHQMMMNSSMNLPKILQVYSNAATQYDARARVLPLIENLKGHYEEIKNAALNNIGEGVTVGQLGVRDTKGQRNNAISQFESWFNNQILDNQGLKSHQGVVEKDVQSNRINKLAKRLGRSAGISFTRIKTAEEKRLSKQIKDILAKDPELTQKLQDIIAKAPVQRTAEESKMLEDNEGIVSLIKQLNNMGRFFSLSTVMRGLQQFLILKFMGLNMPAAAFNFIEGQISNGISAARGIYFPPEYANYISPMAIIASSSKARLLGEGSLDHEIWILNNLIHRYDLLNDVAREIQTSSKQNVFTGTVQSFLMLPTRKTEYLNQAPLIASMLRDTSIVGKNGETTHIFDAMERVEVSPKKYELKLKDNFDTVENRAAWLRDFEGLTEEQQVEYNKEYQLKKNKIDEAIRDTHGAYGKFDNMKAKDSVLGQLFMTLRTWITRAMYTRFATKQDDIFLGVEGYKGRYRSGTTVTAATMGVLTGLMTGGVGLAIAGGVALPIINQIGLLGKGKWGAKSGASTLQELAITTQILFLKMLGRPVNTIFSIASPLTGKKRLINTNTNYLLALQDGKLQRTDVTNILVGDNFTERDMQNFKANLTDIANIMMMYALYFAAQLFLGGDDDDDDKQGWNHLMVNTAMQLARQATTYTNLYEMGQQVNPNNTAVYKFITTDLAKFLKNVSTPGVIESYGDNSGKNRAWTSFSRAFIPGIVQNPLSIGFETRFERQFEKSPLDKWFWDTEKNSQESIRQIRAKDKAEMIANGMTDEEAAKAIKKKYGRKDKDQSYESYLKEVENITELPEEL